MPATMHAAVAGSRSWGSRMPRTSPMKLLRETGREAAARIRGISPARERFADYPSTCLATSIPGSRTIASRGTPARSAREILSRKKCSISSIAFS